ncbi:MAG: endo-1,4-beta-xylanase [Pseudomonadota bacterium]
MGNKRVALGFVLFACACGSSQNAGGGGASGSGALATGGIAGALTTGGAAGSTPNALGGAGTVATAGTGGLSAGGASSVAGDSSTGGLPNAGSANNGGSAGNAGSTSVLDASCGGANSSATNLKDKYAGCFPIGAAVDAQSYTTYAPILKAHFNSVVAENEMKFNALEPSEGGFSYSNADKIVDFATSNAMKIRGHTLVWHSQNPSWLFAGASKDTLLARMKNHIKNVLQHYKGKVYAWDVVNEAIMDDGSYRTGSGPADQQSRWYEIIGPSYIAEAFRAAHDADPNAKLFYNDFYDYIPAKQQAIYNMLKGLLADGVPVHGVGMQCHLNIQPSTKSDNQAFYQSVENLEKAIVLYSSLGLEVQVTEMDLSLYIPGISYTRDTFLHRGNLHRRAPD